MAEAPLQVAVERITLRSVPWPCVWRRLTPAETGETQVPEVARNFWEKTRGGKHVKNIQVSFFLSQFIKGAAVSFEILNSVSDKRKMKCSVSDLHTHPCEAWALYGRSHHSEAWRDERRRHGWARETGPPLSRVPLMPIWEKLCCDSSTNFYLGEALLWFSNITSTVFM